MLNSIDRGLELVRGTVGRSVLITYLIPLVPSVGFCRESRVEVIMSRVESKMSRVEGKCRGFKNVGIFFYFNKKNKTNRLNKTKQNKKH